MKNTLQNAIFLKSIILLYDLYVYDITHINYLCMGNFDKNWCKEGQYAKAY